jgi:hypothetical protein
MNTTTNTTHADRIFSPGRYFAPAARYFALEARYFAPEGRYFAPAARYDSPQTALTGSTSCSSFPARVAGPAPGPARPGVGWLRLP